ncbi:AAA family ATPase [Conexibacter sp. SYSU D00693]|uniref:AAA family ATPase n=1 Tax=Conexibacter sp. SYSU D00693 TaxID=2812560 RepID=UPI00196A3FD8|nr:AAA family ATPase [Conexibacter sp. SYSU D00693]
MSAEPLPSMTAFQAQLAVIEGGMVVPPGETHNHHPPVLGAREQARRCIRFVDMGVELAKPEEAQVWRVDRFAQDGALTTLAARGGAGKSWLGMALCHAVTTGTPAAGISTTPGVAVYVDGEMGTRMMTRRWRDCGLPRDAFKYVDAMGLDLGAQAGVDALAEALARVQARFIVFDSLRRLAPGKKENESDDMAPLVASLANVCRELDAAGLLLHHAGHDDTRAVRGSSAIVDQSDAVFTARRLADTTISLECDPLKGGKFRMDEEPPARLLKIVAHGGRVVVEGSPLATTTTPRQSASDRMTERIQQVMREEATPLRKTAIAELCVVSADTPSFRDAFRQLRRLDVVVETEHGFVLAGTPTQDSMLAEAAR